MEVCGVLSNCVNLGADFGPNLRSLAWQGDEFVLMNNKGPAVRKLVLSETHRGMFVEPHNLFDIIEKRS
jgi:hypothetical protein